MLFLSGDLSARKITDIQSPIAVSLWTLHIRRVRRHNFDVSKRAIVCLLSKWNNMFSKDESWQVLCPHLRFHLRMLKDPVCRKQQVFSNIGFMLLLYILVTRARSWNLRTSPQKLSYPNPIWIWTWRALPPKPKLALEVKTTHFCLMLVENWQGGTIFQISNITLPSLAVLNVRIFFCSNRRIISWMN